MTKTMEWDGKRQAAPGLFRVLGEDMFAIPPEEYWIGDYADYESAKEAARSRAASMNPATVYDDQGKTLFIAHVKASE